MIASCITYSILWASPFLIVMGIFLFYERVIGETLDPGTTFATVSVIGNLEELIMMVPEHLSCYIRMMVS